MATIKLKLIDDLCFFLIHIYIRVDFLTESMHKWTGESFFVWALSGFHELCSMMGSFELVFIDYKIKICKGNKFQAPKTFTITYHYFNEFLIHLHFLYLDIVPLLIIFHNHIYYKLEQSLNIITRIPQTHLNTFRERFSILNLMPFYKHTRFESYILVKQIFLM